MKILKIKFHSVVDVITNSSTVIYTFQNSKVQAKELVQEILNLANIKDKTPDDIFYYKTFPEDDRLKDYYNDNDYSNEMSFEEFKIKLMKDEINTDFIEDITGYTYLYLLPKDEKYTSLADKIERLLCSVDAEEGEN
jgi:hypothetical protein